MATKGEKIIRDIFRDVLSYTSDTPIIPDASFDQLERVVKLKLELEDRNLKKIFAIGCICIAAVVLLSAVTVIFCQGFGFFTPPLSDRNLSIFLLGSFGMGAVLSIIAKGLFPQNR